ncbi:MAG: twin-arginine translocation signal domain-containing protein [Candidatus Rokubacteria bacterium]|nr:twin-arginine translocation signal domain-containing protein [Candidatus Rokubacteria bacterium]
MDVTRRDFLTLLTVAGALGAGSPGALARKG